MPHDFPGFVGTAHGFNERASSERSDGTNSFEYAQHSATNTIDECKRLHRHATSFARRSRIACSIADSQEPSLLEDFQPFSRLAIWLGGI